MFLTMPLIDPIPSPVEHADLAALELQPLLALVAGFAASPVGRDAILALHPSADEEWIGHQHRLTSELKLILEEQVFHSARRPVRSHAAGGESAN
ncbi:MAG: hypothetical protein WDM87_10235 [Terracidiphilus sp.]